MKKEKLQQNMKDRMQQFEDGGLRLLKKGQKGIVHAIFSRFGLVLLLMLLQVGVLWSVFRWFGGLLPHYFGGSVVMSAFMVVYILNSEMDNSAKITWMVTIAILPVVGVPLFFYVSKDYEALLHELTADAEDSLMAADSISDIDERICDSDSIMMRTVGFSIWQAHESELESSEDFERVHIARTIELLVEQSEAIQQALAADKLMIVGARYQLDSGKVEVLSF